MRRTAVVAAMVALTLSSIGCHGSKSGPSVCESNNDCSAGAVCVQGMCHALCRADRDCSGSDICDNDICTSGRRSNAPHIDQVTGNGTSPNLFADAIIIAGTSLQGVDVSLAGASSYDLAIRSEAPDRVEALLPSTLTQGDYELTVTNAAGSDQQGITVLQGEPSTPAAVLSMLLQVDGSGSGVDADYLDGLDSSQFLQGTGGSISGKFELASTAAGSAQIPIDPASLTNARLGSFNPRQVVDGDVTTVGWDTTGSTPGAEVQVDFGAGQAQDVVRVRLDVSGAGYTGTYDVEYSDDGATWQTASHAFAPRDPNWNERSWPSVGAHEFWRLVLVNQPTVQANPPTINEMQLFASAPGAALTLTQDARVGVGVENPQAKLDVAGTIRHQGIEGRLCPNNNYFAMGYCLPKGDYAEKSSCPSGATLQNGVCYSWPTATGAQCRFETLSAAMNDCAAQGATGRLCTVAELDRLDGTGCGGNQGRTWANLAPTYDANATFGLCLPTATGLTAAKATLRSAGGGYDDIAACDAVKGAAVTAASAADGLVLCCFD